MISNDRKRPKFGGRYLTDKEQVFKHNAWDDVEWTNDQIKEALEIVERQSLIKVCDKERQHYEEEAHNYWNKFYAIHDNRFFKDRNWLFTELPELSHLRAGSKALLEIGCGSGSSVFPILQRISNPDFKLFCCDFSSTAIEIIKTNSAFDQNRCVPFRCDVTDPEQWMTSPLNPESIDITLIIFALSAMESTKMSSVISNVYKYLKPGGLVFFRDYGEFDLAQLRFKPGKCIDDNFYLRGDGTRCFFFNKDFVNHLFSSAGYLKKDLKVDRRLQVNRGKQLKMYRIWVQGIYQKPAT